LAVGRWRHAHDGAGEPFRSASSKPQCRPATFTVRRLAGSKVNITVIQIKRVYDPPAKEDDARFLVERLWPRGMKKDALHMDGWCKELAPSDDLRRWFSHDPAKWKEFQRRYRAELAANPAVCQPLLDAAKQGTVTLLYSARDTEHNSAIVLKSYLEERLRGRKRRMG
jgi:uncharacterized protein YeaO (DUF488 family)